MPEAEVASAVNPAPPLKAAMDEWMDASGALPNDTPAPVLAEASMFEIGSSPAVSPEITRPSPSFS
jgi:hypothetical protein